MRSYRVSALPKGNSNASSSLKHVGYPSAFNHTRLRGDSSITVISIISDFFLSAFPILILRKVQIRLRDKVGLCLLMGLGVITGSLSIVRTVLNNQTESDDPTWDVIPNWYWRSWEVFFGIAAACIPALRPGYKWCKRYIRTKLNTSGEEDADLKPSPGGGKPVTWKPPKPSMRLTSATKKKKRALTNSLVTTTTTATTMDQGDDDDAIPLSDVSGGGGATTVRASVESYPPGTADPPRYPADEQGNERKEALHIPGDLSTRRPGHFKRLDSEAKIGGGLGAEEVDYRL